MTLIEVAEGAGPLVLGLPHTGTEVPADLRARLNANGRLLADTDWHVERLYAGLLPGVTTLRATHHRYVLDVNRPPDGASLYPGQNTTGLCPVTDFDGRDLWLPGAAPGADEIAGRVARYHAPYHAALAAQMERVQARHGVAILFDCHSIRSRIPHLFEGVLPDFNIGTADGASCAPLLAEAVRDICARAEGYSHVVNGRFRGGWTTRHYGRPGRGWHAVQMELAQSTHLTAEAQPFALDEAKSARLRPILSHILQTLADLAPQLKG